MFFQQLISGISIGSTYALVAMGYALVHGVLGLVNFANGNIYMMGAFITLVFFSAFDGYFVIAFILSALLTAFFGYGMDAFGLRRLRMKNSPKMTGIIMTLGFSMVIEHGVRLFITSESVAFPAYLDRGFFKIGNTVINWSQIIILGCAMLIMLFTTILVNKTKIGKAMLAVSQNPEASMLMGINTNRVISFTFALSSFIAMASGTLVGMYYHVMDSSMGATVGMKALASAVLGGIGSLPGAMIGGVIIGILEALGASYISSAYRNAIAFIVLIVIILIKPSGLLGKKQIEKV